jgi:hypothetical protein
MHPRESKKQKRENHSSFISRAVKLLFLLGIALVSFVLVILLWEDSIYTPGNQQVPEQEATDTAVTEVQPETDILDFFMVDLFRGWALSTSGILQTTNGGVEWKNISNTVLHGVGETNEEINLLDLHEDWSAVEAEWLPLIAGAEVNEDMDLSAYEVRKVQTLTDQIAWALMSDESSSVFTLRITVDGGKTWHNQVTPVIVQALKAEEELAELFSYEAAYYMKAETADAAVDAAWTLIPDTVNPGDAMLVRHQNAGELIWEGKTYALQPFGTGYYTYLPMSISIKPGEYPIGDQLLKVQAKTFETQYLEVSEQLQGMTRDTQRIQTDQLKIDQARSQSAPKFLFPGDSTFVQPVEGRLTTPYGYTRYVNGEFSGSHRAIDLAAPEGTPVMASNDGKVVLADELYLTGNSIYIDHGMHLFSQYIHLSELNVKTGDEVKKGDIIGLVGTTGFSTGPHLHFTFWAHNVPVNPNLFFNQTPFHWYQYQ